MSPQTPVQRTSVPERGNACAVTPGQRVARGVMALVVGTAAVAAGGSGLLWIAIPAGVFAVFLVIGAVTGWCPTSLFSAQGTGAIGTDHGYPDARLLVRLDGRRPTRGGDS